MNKKKLVIDGNKIQMEKRYCSCVRCNSVFWAATTSNQSICGINCWEVTYQKRWSSDQMPKIKPYQNSRKKKRHSKANTI